MSCSVYQLEKVDITGFSYDGKSVYLNGEEIEKLSGMEMAYDNKSLVREATFVLLAQNIISMPLKLSKLFDKKIKLIQKI